MRFGRSGKRSHTGGSLAIVAACAVAIAVPGAVTASTGGATASAPDSGHAAKRKACGQGKVRVNRPGRSSVCAKPCRSGFKRKVTKKGKVSCVRKGTGKRKAGGRAPGAKPPASTGPANGTYSGTSEQGRSLTFTVSGGQVTEFVAGVNNYCNTPGNSRFEFDAIANVPPLAIGPDGSFSYTGDSDTGNAEVSGRIVGGSATGTVGMSRGDSNYDYSSGMTSFGTCSAHDVTWSAAAG